MLWHSKHDTATRAATQSQTADQLDMFGAMADGSVVAVEGYLSHVEARRDAYCGGI
jgi:hypothetical protein